MSIDNGPITPEQVEALRPVRIPGEVYAAFNALILERFSDGRAVFTQAEVVARAIDNLRKNGRKVRADDFFNNHWLDVEPAYRGAGWTVDYDKPGFNETYEAYFMFSRPKPEGKP